MGHRSPIFLIAASLLAGSGVAAQEAQEAPREALGAVAQGRGAAG